MKLIFGGGKAEYWRVGTTEYRTPTTLEAPAGKPHSVWWYWLPEYKTIRGLTNYWQWITKSGNAAFDLPTPPDVIAQAGRAWKTILKHNHFIHEAEKWGEWEIRFELSVSRWSKRICKSYLPFYLALAKDPLWEHNEKYLCLSALVDCMEENADPDAESLRAWVDYYWAPGYDERVLVPHLPPPYLE